MVTEKRENMLRRYQSLLQSGQFRNANEVVEPFWRQTRSNMEKALCQIAIALYQHQRGHLEGTRKLLEKAHQILSSSLAEGWQDPHLDVPTILSAVEESLSQLDRVQGSPTRNSQDKILKLSDAVAEAISV